jgi:hypothetical protein
MILNVDGNEGEPNGNFLWYASLRLRGQTHLMYCIICTIFFRTYFAIVRRNELLFNAPLQFRVFALHSAGT